jgi:hypothetical protein
VVRVHKRPGVGDADSSNLSVKSVNRPARALTMVAYWIAAARSKGKMYSANTFAAVVLRASRSGYYGAHKSWLR